MPTPPPKPDEPAPTSNKRESSASPQSRSQSKEKNGGRRKKKPGKKKKDTRQTPVPAREPMDLCPVTFMHCFRLTHSDVMTTTNTALVSHPLAGLPGSEKKKGGVDATASRPRAALSAANTRRHGLLIKEQQRFMSHLRAERRERFEYETWAATAAQAVWRGHTARPPSEEHAEERARRKAERSAERKRAARLGRQEVQGSVQKLMRRAKEMHALPDEEEGDIRDLAHNEWRLDQAKELRRKRQAAARRAAMKEGAMKAQAMCRGFLVRRSCRILRTLHYDEEITLAAVTIQTQARATHAQRRRRLARLRNKNKYSLTIQRVFRGYRERRWARLVRDLYIENVASNRAAVAVQTRIRRHLARRRAQEKKTLSSAVAVQAQYRGYKDRRDKWQREENVRREDAALKLQTKGRGLLARRRVADKKGAIEAEKRDEAATAIQSRHRGRQAKAAVEARREQRALEAKVKADMERERAAADAEQQKRRAAAKRAEEERSQAATVLQSKTRGRQASKIVGEKREQKSAATKVQAAQRAKIARREVESVRAKKKAMLEEQAAQSGAARRKVKRGAM
jgi:hypothetical protein